MHRRLAIPAASLLFVAHASAQTLLFGFRGNGDVILIERTTGQGRLVARTGVECGGATAVNFENGRAGAFNRLYFGGGTGATADQVSVLEGWTLVPQPPIPTTGRPAGYGVRGLLYTSFSLSDFAVLLASEDPSAPELLATIDSGNYTIVGPLARRDLWSLAQLPFTNTAYTLSTEGDGALYTIDLTTGALTLIGGGGYGDARALTFLPTGQLLACGDSLYSVNLTTGAATPIGGTGFTDIRGLAITSGCYADCDRGPPPQYSVNDFVCFLSNFVAGTPYANCDLSTTPPVLNVNDFVCFQSRFASGCLP